MTAYAHLDALRDKHAAIDRDIQSEERRPMPDIDQIALLKKRKLQLKDEMRRVGDS